MKEGWVETNLGDVVDILDNLRKPITKKDRIEGEYPYYGATGILSYVHDYIFSEKLVLIGEDGAKWESGERTAFVADGKYWVNNHAHVIRPHRKDITDDWLVYYLNHSDLLPFVSGMTVPKLNQKNLKSIPLPLPSLPEQKRIVSILDRAFAAIDQATANYKKCLSLSKELFESYLQTAFENTGQGWEELKLNEIGLTQTGNTPKTSEKENYGDYIPFIKPADVDFSGVGDLRYDNNGLSEIGFKKARSMKKGSILMVCIGATIGKVGFAEQDVTSNQQINSLTLSDGYFPKFFYYAMTSTVFQEKVLTAGKGAQATLPIINKSKWESLTIPFPKSVSEQESYSHRFDALQEETQKLETLYQKKIDALDELKKSILQKAFQGELRGDEVAVQEIEKELVV